MEYQREVQKGPTPRLQYSAEDILLESNVFKALGAPFAVKTRTIEVQPDLSQSFHVWKVIHAVLNYGIYIASISLEILRI